MTTIRIRIADALRWASRKLDPGYWTRTVNRYFESDEHKKMIAFYARAEKRMRERERV